MIWAYSVRISAYCLLFFWKKAEFSPVGPQTIERFQALNDYIGSILSMTTWRADINSISMLVCLQMLFSSCTRMSRSSRYLVKKTKSAAVVLTAKACEKSVG